MNIDHVHFYVEDASTSRVWFTQMLGFQAVGAIATADTLTEIVKHGSIYFALSSPQNSASPVAVFLQQHPPGVADVVFRVTNLEATLGRAIAAGAKVLQHLQQQTRSDGCLKWAQIAAWGSLRHTLVERSGLTPLLPLETDSRAVWQPLSVWEHEWMLHQPAAQPQTQCLVRDPDLPTELFTQIDHVVLNVAAGDLPQVVTWYEQTLGFQPRQTFAIQTDYSGLRSQVLVHPEGRAQLPINEPVSQTSQIQEFLDLNRGPGIQHIALQTADILTAIAQLRDRGLALLSVPTTYYTQLYERPGFEPADLDWQAIAKQQILVDWQSEAHPAKLLQTFTQPIFSQPTFFFELIERQVYQIKGRYQQAQGFGEGNFRALFEAVEREQLKRNVSL